jgi:hypothetical protein
MQLGSPFDALHEALAASGNHVSDVEIVYTAAISKLPNICVYFGSGQLAYRFNLDLMSPEGKEAFQEDLSNHKLAAVKDVRRYK